VSSGPPFVLVTGASGRVGRLLVPQLATRYRLRLHSRSTHIAVPKGPHESVMGDIESAADVAEMMAGVDAVVHLAGESGARASWDEVRGPNIDGIYNVFEAARVGGVRRVVFASTNHVMGMYDREQAWPIHPEQPIRADGPYAVSKAFGEVLGRYYAEAHALEVVCLRIGWVLERPFNEQGLRMWLSPGDLKRLMIGALEAPVRFGVYYGVSANTRCHWDVENTRLELGYQPVDDAEVFADEILASE
jgi:NAD+ dependent glucose-6-phosphate dehydrogenase